MVVRRGRQKRRKRVMGVPVKVTDREDSRVGPGRVAPEPALPRLRGWLLHKPRIPARPGHVRGRRPPRSRATRARGQGPWSLRPPRSRQALIPLQEPRTTDCRQPPAGSRRFPGRRPPMQPAPVNERVGSSLAVPYLMPGTIAVGRWAVNAADVYPQTGRRV
jgi:hypothetical protein